MNGKYLACPECLKLEPLDKNNWYAVFQEEKEYAITVGEDGEIDYEPAELTESELIEVYHQDDDGRICFRTESWEPADFIIEIKDNKIVGLGEYWETFKDSDEFKKLVKKYNLKTEESLE